MWSLTKQVQGLASWLIKLLFFYFFTSMGTWDLICGTHVTNQAQVYMSPASEKVDAASQTFHIGVLRGQRENMLQEWVGE